jgi:hypothetical protein
MSSAKICERLRIKLFCSKGNPTDIRGVALVHLVDGGAFPVASQCLAAANDASLQPR